MNNYFEEIQNWEPLNQMEDATESMYQDRINKSYNCILPHSKLSILPYVGEKEIVEYKYPELVALCPVTFFPDIYNVILRFIPNVSIPELKSLKFYYMDYIHLPISHEHIASKIYAEFKSQINPDKMSLHLIVNVRGGIETSVHLGDSI